MSVTDPTAVAFSNDRIRVAADRLANAYYLCQSVSDRWTALGGGQPAIDVMEADIRFAAQHVADLYELCWRTEKLWFVLGSTSLIPNDPVEDIVDGSPADGRPAANGEDAVRVVDRVVQLQNWLLSTDGDFTAAARAGLAYYNTIIAASEDGPVTLSVADAGNFINRCNELETNYDASGGFNLTTVLAIAVNPTNQALPSES